MDDLVAKCQKLQSRLTPVAEHVRQFIAGCPDAQLGLSPLLEELLCLPNIVVALERDARDCEQEQGLLLMTQGILDVCGENLRQIEQVLSSAGQREIGAVTDQAATLASFLATARKTLKLSVDALHLVKGLRQAEQTGDSPPYEASSILQEISSIQALLNEQSTSEHTLGVLQQLSAQTQSQSGVNIHQLQSITLGGFLNFLKAHVEQQSGSIPPSEVARRTIAAGHAAPNRPATRDTGVDERYLAPTILSPAPSPVTFRHIGKVVMNLEKEPQDIKFMCPRGDTRTFAVSNFHKDVVLFNAITGERKKDFKVRGLHMVFSPVSDVMALTVEHFDEVLTHKPKVVPLSHDLVHFEKPALYVLDTPQGPGLARRRFFLQWRGIRPFSFSPDGTLLAIKGVRNRVEIVSDSGHGYGVVRSHTDEVTHAEFTTGGERLVTMSRDGTLRVTHVPSMRNVAKLEMENWRNPLQLAVSPLGVVASIWGRTVTVWDYETGAMNSYNLETARGSEGWPLAISPDLRWVASRTDDGADVTDLGTGKVVYSARLESGFATSAAFSLDGRHLVVGRCSNGHHTRTDSGILNVWEIET